MKVKSLPLAGAAAMAAACALFAMASPARAAADSVVVFNEIHYHPADEINETEWIELRNLQGVDVDISGWRMRGGADFDFPEGTVVPGRGYLVIAKVPTQIAGALGPFDGNLSNSGEELRLENRDRRVMDRLDYGDDGDWPVGSDGSGATLARADQTNADSRPRNWAASAEIGGTPGAANFPVGGLPPTVTQVIAIDDSWKFQSGSAPAGWEQAGFDDSAWQSGQALFYKGDAEIIGAHDGELNPATAGDGLVGYWDFNDNVSDQSGTGNNGTLSGAAYSTDVPAALASGKSLDFDAAADGVTVADNASLNSGNFTISMFIKDRGQAAGVNRLWSRGGDTCDFGIDVAAAGTNSLAFKTPDIAWGPTAAVPPANAWMHIAWVCQGNTISLYANGAKVFGPASFPVAPSGVLHIGNRHNNVEGFNGLIDDVALWNKALPDEAIAGLAAGTYSPLTAPSATFGSATDDIGSLILSDDFSGASLDAGKWETVDQGLENAGGTGYNAPSVAGGQLTLGGTATNQYWSGKSVRTVQAFDTSRVITAKVDRVSLAGTGTAWRSSLWLWGDSGHYFHFAHNTENAWSFNANDVGGTGTLTPTGGGTVVQTPADAGSHEMRLTYSPVGGGAGEIAMFLDGVRVGVHQVTNFPGEVKVMLTGQGRATNDTVSAVFDDFEVYDRRAYALPEQLGGEYPELLTELTGSGPHYFRKAFNFPGDLSRTTLFLNPIFDDGAIFYLNGVEIHRQNVPPAEVDSIFFPEQPVVIDGDQLSAGENVLAVELQEAPATTDALFGALLTSSEEPSPPGPAARGLVFSEIAAGGSVDFQIELANLGGDALDLTGYEVRSSAGGTYALGGSLASGGLLAITAADLGFTPADGDRLFLVGPGSALADGREVTGRLRGLTAAGQWLYPSAATFGAANAFAFHENVVINEIMYNPRLIRGTPDIPATYDRQTLLDWGASWRYLEDGAGLPAGWEDSSHPGWLSGPGPLGFEVNTLVVPIATTLQNPANVSIITYYFEAEFNLTAQQIAEMDELRLAHQIDDGAIFYLNGEEIQRYGMPGGAVTSATPAARGDEAIVFTDISIPKSQLVAGTNRLSVELHQTSATSSDFVMGARLESVRELTPFVPGVPAHQNDAQWIELFNKSATDPADLTGWEFADGIRFSFPANTTIAPGEFLVVARDAAKFSAAHPGVPVVGDFDGNLSRGGERLELRDANKNVADAVRFADGGRWDEWADGGGSSLELRDPDADNAAGEAWAASDESGETAWQSVSYTASGANNGNDPALYNEFVMGLLDSGEVLVDDISVIEDPNGAARELIQDGTFGDGNFSEWRIIGNHRHSAIVGDPENPGNNVLRLVATGTAEHLHNHAETTLKFGGAFVAINPALDYRISYRAKPIRGNAQLNTRLFFNRAARTTILDTPAAGGTPGAPNSQLAANAGPTYGGLTHRPAIPAAGAPATVAVQAADPDGIASLILHYAVNGGGFTSVPMADQGGGLFEGTVPPQGNASKVQFYIEAQDALGATAFFPAAGPDSRAIIPWQDGAADLDYGDCQPTNLRIAMTDADAEFMHSLVEVMSNDRLGCTVILNEYEIYYDCGVRLKGSEHGRFQDVRVGWNIAFPPDHLFLGAHEKIAIDRSGAGDSPDQRQREMLVKHAINHAGGIPGMYDDLIRVIAPLGKHSGDAMLLKSRFDDEWLDNQFDNGGDGTMWEYELIYNQTSTDDGTPEGRKIPQSNPGSTAGVAVASLGADPELYRHHWLIKNNKELDDYASLIPVVTAIGQPASAQFIAETNALLDVDEWLRTFAVQVLFGVGDNYAFGAQHNMLIYIRPTDGKAMYMPWDMDFTFSQGATDTLTPSGDLNKLLTDTGNRRAYYGHLLDIMDTTFNAAYLGPWAEHYSCFAPGGPLDGFIATLTARESYARAQIATLFPATSFAITTNGGAAFSVADSQVTLAGDGWVDVREIRLAGGGALPLTWTDDNSWELEVPLGAGVNTITLEAYGFGGQLLGTASIDVTNTSPVQAAAAGNIAITEVMYHPLPATPAEAAALPGILNPQEEFEFIEIQNISGTAVDLSGCAFTNGIDFAFDDGTTLAAGARLLVAGNLDAFRARYGTGLDSLIAGAFASGRLSNSGERLTLTGAGGADVASFSYSDGGAWPGPADGQGASLILVNPDPATDHELPQSWWSSAVSGGEPGSGKSPTYAHWALGKFSAAQLADPAISGLLADPDLDGQPNMVECAANGDPLSGSSLNNLAAGITDLGSGPQPALRFTSANAGDIRLGVLESDDAVHFGIIGDYFLPAAGDDNGDGTWGHEVIDPDTLADAARKIYVLEAQWIWTE